MHRQWHLAEWKGEAHSPMKKEGQVETSKMVSWVGDMKDAWTPGHRFSMRHARAPQEVFLRAWCKLDRTQKRGTKPSQQVPGLLLRETSPCIFHGRRSSLRSLVAMGTQLLDPASVNHMFTSRPIFPKWIHDSWMPCSELADIVFRWVNSWQL